MRKYRLQLFYLFIHIFLWPILYIGYIILFGWINKLDLLPIEIVIVTYVLGSFLFWSGYYLVIKGSLGIVKALKQIEDLK